MSHNRAVFHLVEQGGSTGREPEIEVVGQAIVRAEQRGSILDAAAGCESLKSGCERLLSVNAEIAVVVLCISPCGSDAWNERQTQSGGKPIRQVGVGDGAHGVTYNASRCADCSDQPSRLEAQKSSSARTVRQLTDSLGRILPPI